MVFFSCRQGIDNLINPEKSLSIDDAQSWYESNKPQGLKLAFAKAKSDKGKLNGRPDWKHAYIVDQPEFTVVQVPLSVQGAFCFVTTQNQKAYEETGDKRYVQSLTQMVVQNEKKSQKTSGFLMTIIPDKEYMDATHFKCFYSTYRKWQAGYSGLIFYHTLEGKFTNGWRFANGKVIKSITPIEGDGMDLQLKARSAQKSLKREYGCTDYYYQVWSQDCMDWYTQDENGGIYNGTTCGPWYEDGRRYAYTQCDVYDGSGSVTLPTTPPNGGGGPDGGGSNANFYMIANVITLDEIGKNLLNNKLQEMLDQCGYKTIYNYLTGHNYSIDCVEYYDPQIHTTLIEQAAYLPISNKLVFYDNSKISNDATEEIVHFFQNKTYPGGVNQYQQSINIEFEAKLTVDILRNINYGAGRNYGTSLANADNYHTWLEKITHGFTTFPSYDDLLDKCMECNYWNYWDFMKEFSDNSLIPQYKLPSDINLAPMGMEYINNNYCN